MKTKNNPSAEQKRWMQTIAEWAKNGGIERLYGSEWADSQFHLHHVVGRSYKQNKVAIGHWFIIPVPFELHDVSSNHPLNVTHFRKSFTFRFGLQKELFCAMRDNMIDCGMYEQIPFGLDVLSAIDDTRY